MGRSRVKTQIILPLLTVLVLSLVQQSEAGCFLGTPSGFSSDNFFPTPQNVTLAACDYSNENSCCTSALSSAILTYSDTWSSTLLQQGGFFNYTSNNCRQSIQGSVCLLCSASQNVYTSFQGNELYYFICLSLCEEMYTACGSSRLHNGTNVTDVYTQASQFCFDLYSQLNSLNVHLVIVNGETNCFINEPECTDSSYYYLYTECVNGARNKIYQKKPEVTCAGGVSLPPTVYGLPCAVSCPIGQYVSEHGCLNCSSGSYSLGSAVREDSWADWSQLNIPFATYCTYTDLYRVEHILNDTSCGWQLTGGFEINSGVVNNSQSAYLETSITLLEDGHLAFNFKVDAEPHFDGFIVYVDRAIAYPKVSTQYDYQLVILNLTAGYHFIQFVYTKDISVSVGLDQAALNLVQFTPVVYASEECTPCRPGRYQKTQGMSYCNDCPANTYSHTGASNCTKCPPNTYSFSGASNCTQQVDCTDEDLHFTYGECYFNENNELMQDQYPVWNTPHICNDHGNPTPTNANITNTCVPCNPGTLRVGTDCQYCPDGFYNNGTMENCEQCHAGSAANKVLYVNYFDNLDSEFSTDCTYFCGSPGWEGHNEYISSGSGHGRYVNSNLRLNTSLSVPGHLKFAFSLTCASDCTFSFNIQNSTGGTYTSGPGKQNLTDIVVLRNVPAGDVYIQWTFVKNDPNDIGRYDQAQIDYIYVTNVIVGGAIVCTDCPAGKYAGEDGSLYCTPCPAGSYSSEIGSTACTDCPPGTYAAEEASTTCSQCGESTQSSEDRTSCIVSCSYTDDATGWIYDISSMSRRDDEMTGPIYDANNNVYYLNLCQKHHNNNTCLGLNGDPLETFGCQVTGLGIGEDLGNVFGIIPLRENSFTTEGVTVHLTNGAACVNSTTGQHFPREAYIDILCTPDGGVGYPFPLNFQDVVETSKCVYEFTWPSLYGCHVCNEDDITYIISACNEQQKRYIIYQWINIPMNCHGGVDLPAMQELSCVNTDSTYCAPGFYLDLSVSEPVCTPTDPGYYSIGGGKEYTDWDPLPQSFSSLAWTSNEDGSAIRSGSGASNLFYLTNFVERGSLKVNFKIFGKVKNSIEEGFTIFMDGDVIYGPVSATGGVFESIIIEDIPVGNRFFSFEFSGGVVTSQNHENDADYIDNFICDSHNVGVMISEIIVVGTMHAAEYQTLCPDGLVSFGEASSCTYCPDGTFPLSTSECEDCPDHSYSFDDSCFWSDPCTLENFVLTYGMCENGVRRASYIPLYPTHCTMNDSTIDISIDQTIPCNQFECNPGMYRDSETSPCKKCEVGKYWNGHECAFSQPGYACLLETGYYNQPEPLLPEEFATGCSGKCVSTSNGWRSVSTYLDSGDNGNYGVDSVLELEIEVRAAGSVQFEYKIHVETAECNGILFFINNVQQDLQFHPAGDDYISISFPLQKGTMKLRWVYHQESWTFGFAYLKNIKITGAGSSVTQIACPAGTYSDNQNSYECAPCPAGSFSSAAASTKCSNCPANSFSESDGTTSCTQCGALTSSNNDFTDCVTTCKFSTTNGTVDLNALQETYSGFLFDVGEKEVKLLLNLCSKLESSSSHSRSTLVECIDENTGEPINTYACQVNTTTGYGVDSGRLLNAAVDSKDGITLTYSNGQKSNACPNGITTTVYLTCNPNNDTAVPFTLGGSTSCNLNLQWNTAYACPVCTNDDYVTKTTDCEDGTQSVADIRQTTCFGPQVRNSHSQDCTEPIHISIIVIVIIVVMFIILILIVVVIIIWNRRLHSQYTALVLKKGGDGAYEMDEMPNSAVDDAKEAKEAK